MTTTLTYGTLHADGSLDVRLFYDHRVLDGVQPALALRDLEQTLSARSATSFSPKRAAA